LSLEISRERIHKDIEGGLALEPTGMAQGQNPLHPTASFITSGTLTSFPPQNSKANGSLSPTKEVGLN